MTDLSLKRLVLYKSGIGYFVREGNLDGDTLSLTFNQDDVNDVLKSLSVFDYAGGQVVGINYDTPIDPTIRMAENIFRLSDDESLKSLLGDLRGREVQATIGEKSETISGQVIGIDVDHETTRVVLLLENGQMRVFLLSDLVELQILDEQSQADLLEFLANNKSESDRRTIDVQLSWGKHELSVSYVAPSPNWRVSYRVIAESDEGKNTGNAVLLGWGLFDNHIEDLEDVHVTLVAGSPISFQYDLYSSNIPEQERVKDQVESIQGPIEYQGATRPQAYDASPDSLEQIELSKKHSFPDRLSGLMPKKQEEALSTGERYGYPQRRVAGMDIASSVASTTEGKHSAETFQYIVTQPVTVKRGVSALVPIINRENIPYKREVLYNYMKNQNHPVVALRMKNSTGFILERGPVTVVEDGDYKGEAVVPFTREDGELYLPYAVERGIAVHRQLKSSFEEAGRYIKDIELISESYRYYTYTYTLENKTNREQTVRIEHDRITAIRNESFELFDTPEPEEDSATFWRWSVTVAPNHREEFVVVEREFLQSKKIIAGGCNPFRHIIARILPIIRPDLRRRHPTR